MCYSNISEPGFPCDGISSYELLSLFPPVYPVPKNSSTYSYPSVAVSRISGKGQNAVFTIQCKEVLLTAQYIQAKGVAVKPEKACIAFSPALPQSEKYAEILSAGIAELRKSGELKQILSKYGLEDWKK